MPGGMTGGSAKQNRNGGASVAAGAPSVSSVGREGGSKSSSSPSSSKSGSRNDGGRDRQGDTSSNLGFGGSPSHTSPVQAYHQGPSYTYNPETGGSYTVGSRINPNVISNPNPFREALSPAGQRLFEAQRQAALDNGVTARAFSGLAGRKTGTTNHPRGNAIDVSIAGPNGKYLPNYQNAGAFHSYETFAQDVKRVLDNNGPDDNVRWGGYFAAGTNPLDLMHMDVNAVDRYGNPLGMAGGSWENGATRRQLAALPGAITSGMGTQPVTQVASVDHSPPAPQNKGILGAIDSFKRVISGSPIQTAAAAQPKRSGILGTIANLQDAGILPPPSDPEAVAENTAQPDVPTTAPAPQGGLIGMLASLFPQGSGVPGAPGVLGSFGQGRGGGNMTAPILPQQVATAAPFNYDALIQRLSQGIV